MSSRQVRIGNTAISSHRNELPGKSANIVLDTGQVFLVEILSVTEEVILARNFRSKKVSIPIHTVIEIILNH